MYAEHNTLQVIGQVTIAVYFIWMGVKNVLLWDFNVKRIEVQGLPGVQCLVFGFTIQFIGAAMLLIDWHADVGAMLLILFTFLATALFHRYWEMENPQRTYHFLLGTNNIAVTAGLLLLLAIA